MIACAGYDPELSGPPPTLPAPTYHHPPEDPALRAALDAARTEKTRLEEKVSPFAEASELAAAEVVYRQALSAFRDSEARRAEEAQSAGNLLTGTEGWIEGCQRQWESHLDKLRVERESEQLKMRNLQLLATKRMQDQAAAAEASRVAAEAARVAAVVQPPPPLLAPSPMPPAINAPAGFPPQPPLHSAGTPGMPSGWPPLQSGGTVPVFDPYPTAWALMSCQTQATAAHREQFSAYTDLSARYIQLVAENAALKSENEALRTVLTDKLDRIPVRYRHII